MSLAVVPGWISMSLIWPVPATTTDNFFIVISIVGCGLMPDGAAGSFTRLFGTCVTSLSSSFSFQQDKLPVKARLPDSLHVGFAISDQTRRCARGITD